MKNIILTGYTGTGKSVIGRTIAETLAFSFVETEERMISITGYSPIQVIKKYGQLRYRSEEELIFKRLAAGTEQVIAVGSLLTERERLMLLKATGFFVMLRVSDSVLLRRLQKKSSKKIYLPDLRDAIAAYEAMCLPLADFVLDIGEYGIEPAAVVIVEQYRKRK